MRYRPTVYMGTWAGVELRLDLLMVGLIAVLFLNSLRDAGQGADTWAAVVHLLLLLSMMGCMLLHEVGHAVMARLRGHRPTMILLSFVGLTFFDAAKVRARDELWIALSGPMVNLAIGAVFAPFIGLALAESGGPSLFSMAGMAHWKGFLAWLSMLNFVVAAINLTPGWPADGARAVRAWYARRLGYAAGTMRAVQVSHGVWLLIAGFSILLLTVLPHVQALRNESPARSPAALLAMYQAVALLLSALGIYYGWAELRRVARHGADKAGQIAGPPPEFKPGHRPEPRAKEAEGATEVVATGKALWRFSRVTGRGIGWFFKRLARLLLAWLPAREAGSDKPKDAP